MSRRNVAPKKKDESLFQTESELVASETTNPTLSDEPQAILIRIPPFSFIHVLNTNNNVTRLEVGPKSLTCLDHEKVVYGPAQTVVIPPRHYCIITNPVTLDEKNQVVVDKYGQAKLRHGDSEIRYEREPFPLYPGEVLTAINPIKVNEPETALRLRAIRNFQDNDIKRLAGDEWLFKGPGTYLPQVSVEIVETISSKILGAHQALHLKARKEFKDRNSIVRKAGEEWLVRTEGAYLPDVDEIVVCIVDGYFLKKSQTGLHLRAKKTFTDIGGKDRKAGEQWLVTHEDREVHIPDVYEEVVEQVNCITLNTRQYCVICDPVDESGTPQLGKRKLVKGRNHFFLKPGERLENGIQGVIVLGAEEALLVRAKEGFQERKPGDRWFVYGPGEYFPPIEVQVMERRKALVAIEGMGVYLFYSKVSLVLFLILAFFVSLMLPYLFGGSSNEENKKTEL